MGVACAWEWHVRGSGMYVGVACTRGRTREWHVRGGGMYEGAYEGVATLIPVD